MVEKFRLDEQFAHLGLGGAAQAQPAFDGVAWYESYGERTAADGAEGRLVALHRFTQSWPTWEVHPHGAELVLVTEGEMTLIQQVEGKERRVTLRKGEYAINPPGVWHTADIDGEAEALFITPGLDTENRDR